MLPELMPYFESTGCGTLGVDLYMGKLPLEPEDCAGVFEAPGQPPVMDFQGVAYERPRLLILVRSASYPDARSRAETFYRACLAVKNMVLSSAVYLAAIPSGPPFLHERDDHHRPVIGLEVTLHKQLSPLGD